MDKFTIDLDKVLDEFEFKEDQEESEKIILESKLRIYTEDSSLQPATIPCSITNGVIIPNGDFRDNVMPNEGMLPSQALEIQLSNGIPKEQENDHVQEVDYSDTQIEPLPLIVEDEENKKSNISSNIVDFVQDLVSFDDDVIQVVSKVDEKIVCNLDLLTGIDLPAVSPTDGDQERLVIQDAPPNFLTGHEVKDIETNNLAISTAPSIEENGDEVVLELNGEINAEVIDNDCVQEVSKVKFGDFVPEVSEKDLEDLLDDLSEDLNYKRCDGSEKSEKVGDAEMSDIAILDADNVGSTSGLSGDICDVASVSSSEIKIAEEEGSLPQDNEERAEKSNFSEVVEQVQPVASVASAAVESEPDVIGRNEVAMQPDIVGRKDVEPDLVQHVEVSSVAVVRSDSPRPHDLVLDGGTDIVLGSPGTTPHSRVPPEFFTDEAELAASSSTVTEGSHTFPEPYTSLTEEERALGIIKPFWIPDEDAMSCMHCDTKFTLIKRRHHCRACGKVFCSVCCNMRSKIEYMENKEERVCQHCFATLSKVEAYKKYATPSSPSSSSPQERRPNPNNPAEYCSTVPPLQQAASSSRGPPVVMVPVGVLKREGSTSKSRTEQKQVMFSDGIRPGGDLTALDEGQQTTVRPSKRPNKSRKSTGSAVCKSNRSDLPTSFLPKDGVSLPPILRRKPDTPASAFKFEEHTDVSDLLARLREEDEEPVTFALNKNLIVNVKIVNLDCCVNKTCWSFTTKGLRAVGQDELMVLIEELPSGETIVPRDIFVHINNVYEQASKGHILHELDYSSFDAPFLSSNEITGALYVRPTFQCVKKLDPPPTPFLFCLLIQRSEMPWAKVLPLRLMLRLGAEYRYYPCPLYSSRERSPVFREIGTTVVNILADLRNFSYTLPIIKGLTIHIEDKQTVVSLPKTYHSQIMRAVNQSNENVLAFGASFNLKSDSHLVCIQQPDGSYPTQAINIQNRPRSATGANFIVFNGILKTTSGLSGKSSLVEDGVMVQILPDTMVALRNSLKEMKDFQIDCGPVTEKNAGEVVQLRWTDECSAVNVGVKSPIDGRCLTGVHSARVYTGMELQCGTKAIRWNELYFIKLSPVHSTPSSDVRVRPEDVPELSKCCESVAKAACNALAIHLESLWEGDLSPLAVRLTLEAEQAEYEAGVCGQRLPSIYTNDLDSHLIPVMLNESSKFTKGSCVVELWFYIVDKV